MYKYLEKHHKYLFNIPLIIYWLILFLLTSLPSSSAITIGVSDKIEHFGAYGLLSGILYLNLFFQNKFKVLKKYPATFTVLIASFYGLLDELHQLFVPGRSAEIFDWVADFSGAVVGVLITRYLLKKLQNYDYEKSKLKIGTL
ncbi:MAG TPA: VanZ family protein [Ignavibacteriaceae bacterium]|nr:VanZ family protein [Ignavibacterium sp.]HRN25734.1 VanZ family protein [Ignavibacteriaceae bacterium]HRQ53989.1 VanZ family protein [Ignavibacteriaceae bacterium]